MPDEVLLKAIKLLEALTDRCGAMSDDKDHLWRECRRCLAAAEIESGSYAVRRLLKRALYAMHSDRVRGK